MIKYIDSEDLSKLGNESIGKILGLLLRAHGLSLVISDETAPNEPPVLCLLHEATASLLSEFGPHPWTLKEQDAPPWV